MDMRVLVLKKLKQVKKQVWAEGCWFYDSRMGYEWTDKHPCVINDGTGHCKKDLQSKFIVVVSSMLLPN